MVMELQRFIFENNPTRRALVSYSPKCSKQFHVQVFRNHSFELVEHTIGAYLDYAGIGVSFSYSGYDDSFSFTELDQSADLILIWIDMTRYRPETASEFLSGRIGQLRTYTSKNILVIPFGLKAAFQIANIAVFNLTDLEKDLGPQFTDDRAKAVSGTSLSSKAMLRISRLLGLKYLPALLQPALKAIVVDLDNTLYSGVLGEDGVEGLVLTEGHLDLQRALKEMAKRGIFLCIASKNDEDEVFRLFRDRQDFILQKEDFTYICASWDEKARSIEKISSFLNIDSSSMVFIDDNIGELTAVHMAFPEIKLICASDGGRATCKVLSEFPGLFRLNLSSEDTLRKSDIQANQARQHMRQRMDQYEYIRSLGIQITFAQDKLAQAARIAELANKTNQFIFNYKRYTLSDIENMMAAKEYLVVAVSMSDRLSDSGLIGVCVGRKRPDYTEIEECFISCRALGRGVEHVIVLEAIRQISEQFGSKVHICYRQGERNQPASQFVQRYLSRFLAQPDEFDCQIDKNILSVCRFNFESK